MSEGIGTSEAARRLGISRERLVRLVLLGSVRASQVAGRWIVDPVSVTRYAQQRTQEARQMAGAR